MGETMLPQPLPMAVPPRAEPARLKAFGVIHLVFGALGILIFGFIGVAGLVMHVFVDATLVSAAEQAEVVSPAGEIPLADFGEAIRTMVSGVRIYYLAVGVMGLVVAVLALIAGISLVQRRKSSVGRSNLYAWCSLACKVAGVGVYFAFCAPAMREYYTAIQNLMNEAGSVSGAPRISSGTIAMQQAFGIGSQIVLTAVACIYPILALVMLNKPAVKEFLASHGN